MLLLWLTHGLPQAEHAKAYDVAKGRRATQWTTDAGPTSSPLHVVALAMLTCCAHSRATSFRRAVPCHGVLGCSPCSVRRRCRYHEVLTPTTTPKFAFPEAGPPPAQQNVYDTGDAPRAAERPASYLEPSAEQQNFYDGVCPYGSSSTGCPRQRLIAFNFARSGLGAANALTAD